MGAMEYGKLGFGESHIYKILAGTSLVCGQWNIAGRVINSKIPKDPAASWIEHSKHLGCE
jgi:hypothetical protein